MTLDHATDDFEVRPCHKTAAALLTVGLTYWHDEMIGDETFDSDVVKPVRDWLSATARQG